jgi:hypothetical protein
MKMTIDMPRVAGCAIRECAYNIGESCHARAITIGDGVHPGCDTAFLEALDHTHGVNQRAGVGACKVASCLFNADLECTADSIIVGLASKHISCLTYTT